MVLTSPCTTKGTSSQKCCQSCLMTRHRCSDFSPASSASKRARSRLLESCSLENLISWTALLWKARSMGSSTKTDPRQNSRRSLYKKWAQSLADPCPITLTLLTTKIDKRLRWEKCLRIRRKRLKLRTSPAALWRTSVPWCLRTTTTLLIRMPPTQTNTKLWMESHQEWLVWITDPQVFVPCPYRITRRRLAPSRTLTVIKGAGPTMETGTSLSSPQLLLEVAKQTGLHCWAPRTIITLLRMSIGELLTISWNWSLRKNYLCVDQKDHRRAKRNKGDRILGIIMLNCRAIKLRVSIVKNKKVTLQLKERKLQVLKLLQGDRHKVLTSRLSQRKQSVQCLKLLPLATLQVAEWLCSKWWIKSRETNKLMGVTMIQTPLINMMRLWGPCQKAHAVNPSVGMNYRTRIWRRSKVTFWGRSDDSMICITRLPLRISKAKIKLRTRKWSELSKRKRTRLNRNASAKSREKIWCRRPKTLSLQWLCHSKSREVAMGATHAHLSCRESCSRESRLISKTSNRLLIWQEPGRESCSKITL